MLEKERKIDHSLELICEPKLGLQVLGQVLKGGGLIGRIWRCLLSNSTMMYLRAMRCIFFCACMSCRKNHMKQICSKFGNNLQISNRWYHACVKCMYASLHGIYIHGRYNLKYQRTFKQCTHYPCICSSCPRFRKQIQILHKALEVYECSRVHVLKILNLSALASISR